MKKVLSYILLFFAFGCQNVDESTIKTTEPKMNKAVYASIQVFVNANIAANSRSEVYLVEFIGQRSDSIDYKITTLIKKAIPARYKNSLYFYNVDSSLLIVSDNNLPLYEWPDFDNFLHRATGVQFSEDTTNLIFDPPIWRLSLVGKKVYIDKSYGAQEAEKRILPVEKFNPQK